MAHRKHEGADGRDVQPRTHQLRSQRVCSAGRWVGHTLHPACARAEVRCTTYNQTGPHLSERAKAANGSARLVGGRAAAACAAACWLCRLAQRQRGQTTRPAVGAMQRDGGSWITWGLIHSACSLHTGCLPPIMTSQTPRPTLSGRCVSSVRVVNMRVRLSLMNTNSPEVALLQTSGDAGVDRCAARST